MPDTRVWRYRRAADGSTESKIFENPEAVPSGEGWEDSPAKLTEAAPKKRRGRPPKQASASDAEAAGSEQAAAQEAEEVSDDDDG